MNDFTKQVIAESRRGMISAWWLLLLVPFALIGAFWVILFLGMWLFGGKFHLFS